MSEQAGTKDVIDHINNYLSSGSENDFFALQTLIARGSWPFGAQEIVARARAQSDSSGAKSAQVGEGSEIFNSSTSSMAVVTEELADYIAKSAEMFAGDLETLREDPAFTGSSAQIAYMRDILKYGGGEDVRK
jgi:hypothetical protein